MSSSERRKYERFELTIQAMIRRSEHGRAGRPMVLGSRDISAGGAYFPCERPFPVDTRVEVGILIPAPAARKKDAAGSHVKVAGVVVRSDHQGMAIRFDRRYRMTPFPS